jgi:hypothetical protein
MDSWQKKSTKEDMYGLMAEEEYKRGNVWTHGRGIVQKGTFRDS